MLSGLTVLGSANGSHDDKASNGTGGDGTKGTGGTHATGGDGTKGTAGTGGTAGGGTAGGGGRYRRHQGHGRKRVARAARRARSAPAARLAAAPLAAARLAPAAPRARPARPAPAAPSGTAGTAGTGGTKGMAGTGRHRRRTKGTAGTAGTGATKGTAGTAGTGATKGAVAGHGRAPAAPRARHGTGGSKGTSGTKGTGSHGGGSKGTHSIKHGSGKRSRVPRSRVPSRQEVKRFSSNPHAVQREGRRTCFGDLPIPLESSHHPHTKAHVESASQASQRPDREPAGPRRRDLLRGQGSGHREVLPISAPPSSSSSNSSTEPRRFRRSASASKSTVILARPRNPHRFSRAAERAGLARHRTEAEPRASRPPQGQNCFLPALQVFDPDALLDALIGKVRFFFTPYFVSFAGTLIALAAIITLTGWGDITGDFGRLHRSTPCCSRWSPSSSSERPTSSRTA